MDIGMVMLFMSVFTMVPAPDSFAQTRQYSQYSHSSSKHHAKSQKDPQKPLQQGANLPTPEIQPNLKNNESIVQYRQRTVSAAEQHLIDSLLEAKSHDQNQPKCLKATSCPIKYFCKRFVIWAKKLLPPSSKFSLHHSSSKPSCGLATVDVERRIDMFGIGSTQGQSPISIAAGQNQEMNVRIAPVDIVVHHSRKQAPHRHILSAESQINQTPTSNTSPKSPSKLRATLRQLNIMSPELEQKMDKVMEKVTGINCRRGLGRKKEMDMDLSSSYGYGFYWTCCHNICAKSRIMGGLGGCIEVSVTGPVIFLPFDLRTNSAMNFPRSMEYYKNIIGTVLTIL
jgi:hypothetical protein